MRKVFETWLAAWPDPSTSGDKDYREKVIAWLDQTPFGSQVKDIKNLGAP